jgi:hypothetical protein
VSETDGASEVGVDDYILEIYQSLSLLLGHLLLLGDQDHSQSLPDAPSNDQEFFHPL